MDRSYKVNKSSNDGTQTNTMNKVETYQTNMSTKEIMDPKSINRSYEDGHLLFDIGVA